MKKWRLEAGLIKKAAIRQGNHVAGNRYGKLAKAVLGTKLKALPSELFQHLFRRVGVLKKPEPIVPA